MMNWIKNSLMECCNHILGWSLRNVRLLTIPPLNFNTRKYKNELPIGVRPQNKKYQAFCRDRIRGNTYLGTSDTPEGAFILYKIYKENLIKKTADEFKWCLPENVYTAMYNYEININD